MEQIPKIKSVKTGDKRQLMVTFECGTEKLYDCSRVLTRPEFQLLKTPAFFNSVRVDPGGYGISWNDDVDISEYELWTNGKTVTGGTSPDMSVSLTRSSFNASSRLTIGTVWKVSRKVCSFSQCRAPIR